MKRAIGIILSVIQILLALALIFFVPKGVNASVGYIPYETGVEGFDIGLDEILSEYMKFLNYTVIYPAIVFGVLGVIFLIMFITQKKNPDK